MFCFFVCLCLTRFSNIFFKNTKEMNSLGKYNSEKEGEKWKKIVITGPGTNKRIWVFLDSFVQG